MLGLILGRRLGLGCDELRLWRFRAMGPNLGVSDFLPTGPLGDGMAMVRGLGATEPGGRSGADLGSRFGVVLTPEAGDGTVVRTAVSMRGT